jgi:Rad3-related DNA helicase
MRAEFLAAKAPALWLITPWTFEGLDLPPKSIDHLFLTQLPFDYYSHPVLSRRSAHYKDPFLDYFFPRLLHRLFRILRTFCRFRKEGADMRILDDRIRTKGYGKDVVRYLSRFSSEEGTKERSVISGQRSEAPESKSKEKKPTKNKNESQLKMF